MLFQPQGNAVPAVRADYVCGVFFHKAYGVFHGAAFVTRFKQGNIVEVIAKGNRA